MKIYHIYKTRFIGTEEPMGSILCCITSNKECRFDDGSPMHVNHQFICEFMAKDYIQARKVWNQWKQYNFEHLIYILDKNPYDDSKEYQIKNFRTEYKKLLKIYNKLINKNFDNMIYTFESINKVRIAMTTIEQLFIKKFAINIQ